MNFASVAPKESSDDSSFDLQGFRNLLDSLKQSKEQQETKAKPVYNPEE